MYEKIEGDRSEMIRFLAALGGTFSREVDVGSTNR